jgi:hypothetical protein
MQTRRTFLISSAAAYLVADPWTSVLAAHRSKISGCHSLTFFVDTEYKENAAYAASPRDIVAATIRVLNQRPSRLSVRL